MLIYLSSLKFMLLLFGYNSMKKCNLIIFSCLNNKINKIIIYICLLLILIKLKLNLFYFLILNFPKIPQQLNFAHLDLIRWREQVMDVSCNLTIQVLLVPFIQVKALRFLIFQVIIYIILFVVIVIQLVIIVIVIIIKIIRATIIVVLIIIVNVIIFIILLESLPTIYDFLLILQN